MIVLAEVQSVLFLHITLVFAPSTSAYLNSACTASEKRVGFQICTPTLNFWRRSSVRDYKFFQVYRLNKTEDSRTPTELDETRLDCCYLLKGNKPYLGPIILGEAGILIRIMIFDLVSMGSCGAEDKWRRHMPSMQR
mmetsp:Transcript_4989/g.6491  ORF Transcript_4989/g.6491 Transcript_4989/m.6491 type:complete len:137 (-) Transcript_4989:141-551(-)